MPTIFDAQARQRAAPTSRHDVEDGTKKFGISSLCTLSALLLGVAPSWAQSGGTLFRTYLSSAGSDSNPCTLSQPCRLLPAALAQTQDGGEVWMLDSANYNTGQVSIVQSVTIQAVPGVLGSFVSNKAPALDIGVPVNVTLRQVAVRLLNGFDVAVYVHDPKASLTIEDSQFSGFQAEAIAAGGALLNVYRTSFTSNFSGIALNGTPSAPVNAVIDRCVFVGVEASGGYGVVADNANAIVRNSTVSNFGHAIDVTGNGTVALDHNVVTGNTYGAYIALETPQASFVNSLSNNTFFNNQYNSNTQAYFVPVQSR